MIRVASRPSFGTGVTGRANSPESAKATQAAQATQLLESIGLGMIRFHVRPTAPGALLMFHPTESDSPVPQNMHLIEQALKTLKQNVSDHESRLERLCVSWHQTWLSQCEQLRSRIDTLEARLSPWMTERHEGPRLAVISQQEDAA